MIHAEYAAAESEEARRRLAEKRIFLFFLR